MRIQFAKQLPATPKFQRSTNALLWRLGSRLPGERCARTRLSGGDDGTEGVQVVRIVLQFVQLSARVLRATGLQRRFLP